MAELSVSKIWELSKKKGLEQPFAQWLESEKGLYEFKKPTFKKDIEFKAWLNKRYIMKGILNPNATINADAETKTSFLEKVAEVTQKAKDFMVGTPEEQELLKQQNIEAQKAKKDTSILGINRVAFILLVTSATVLIAWGVYSKMKKK